MAVSNFLSSSMVAVTCVRMAVFSSLERRRWRIALALLGWFREILRRQFRNVPQECAFGNRGTIRVPRFPNGIFGKIVPPLFGRISFPSGSFAIGKRVLGNIFQFVPKEAVDFVLEINNDISVAVEVDVAENFCDEGKTPPPCGRQLTWVGTVSILLAYYY